MPRRALKWLAAGLAILLSLPLLLLLWSAVFGWNWARAPLQNWALQRTGRALLIGGDLDVLLAWPLPRVQARAVSFANPPWAAAPQMVVADVAEVSIDLGELVHGRLAFPEVRVRRPQVFLEQAAGGRKNWLLDHAQTDEAARVAIGRVMLDEGRIHYIDPAQQTAVVMDLSTVAEAAPDAPAVKAGAAVGSVRFKAQGRLRGQALNAQGSGGAVLALRDETRPFPLQLQATLGKTEVQASGTVTSLFKLSAVDLQIKLRGDSLATLYPLIGVALPPTPAYRSSGRLVRRGTFWRYESFAGQVGRSDLAGTLQVDTALARPLLTGAVRSRLLDLADLGPAVGARALPSVRVLPDLPLDTTRWAHMDADVSVQAEQLLHEQSVMVEQLRVRLLLQDRQLTLDPFNFAVAGGLLTAMVTLDARAEPMRGRASAKLKGLMLSRLLPTADLRKAGIGRLDGELKLQGQGRSVGQLLASADGHFRLTANKGQISRLLMEQSGLHLLEILRLNLSGDQTVPMNCAVADFKVEHGVMQVQRLVLDTSVNTLVGRGQVDLAQERLDLTIVPHTKVVSVVALRSPIYIKGSFAKPVVDVDRGRIAARGVGALVLGLLNPVLALVPLLDSGPGVENGCQ